MKHPLLSGSMLVLMCTGICAGAQPVAPPAPAAPPGPGWDLIQRSCVSCHDTYMIIGTRRAPADWADIVGRMADRGAEVTPQELQVIEAYLVANFSLPGGEPAPNGSGPR